MLKCYEYVVKCLCRTFRLCWKLVCGAELFAFTTISTLRARRTDGSRIHSSFKRLCRIYHAAHSTLPKAAGPQLLLFVMLFKDALINVMV